MMSRSAFCRKTRLVKWQTDSSLSLLLYSHLGQDGVGGVLQIFFVLAYISMWHAILAFKLKNFLFDIFDRFFLNMARDDFLINGGYFST